MSEMPDFEMPAPMFEDPKPTKKPRRKPAKRKAVVQPSFALKKRVVKKRKIAKRRGRPAGVPNRPKLVVDTSSVATIIGVHAQLSEALSRLSPAERKAMWEMLK